jgi:hypothetical protein
LNKVTDDQWEKFSRTVAAFKHAYDRDPHRKVSVLKGFLIADLSTILPVTEPVKPLAELPDEALIDAFQKAGAAYGSNMPTGLYEFDKDRYEASLKLAAASLRASLSAYAPPPIKGEPIAYITKAALKSWIERTSNDPQSHVLLSSGGELRVPLYASPRPPRKVEVTVEALNAFLALTGLASQLAESVDDPRYVSLEAAIRAAFHVANTQANVRESEAVAEVARLKGDMEQVEAQLDHANVELGLTREALAQAQTQAASLEALLTVPGKDGPVKLWLPFNILKGHFWKNAHIVPAFTFGTGETECVFVYGNFPDFSRVNVREIRQTPAPEQPVRWSYPVSPNSNVFVTTNDPCLLSDLPEAVRGTAWEVRDDGEAA